MRAQEHVRDMLREPPRHAECSGIADLRSVRWDVCCRFRIATHVAPPFTVRLLFYSVHNATPWRYMFSLL